MQLDTIFLLSGGWVQALQLLAALSVLIVLHEFGHFFFARLFKTRVEKFYLFFDFLFPFPNVLPFSLFKKKKGDTVYGVGWFPLGGYVKIAGMVDESMDKEAMKKPPEPWEYRSKKAWQRLLIMLGGIIMNVLTAMAIYAFIFGVWGEQYIPAQSMKYGVVPNDVAESIGIRKGDKILAVGGEKIERIGSVPGEIALQEAKTIEVERDGAKIVLDIPDGTIGKLNKKNKENFVEPRLPVVVGKVSSNSLAEDIGLKKGDSLIAVNGNPTLFFDELEEAKQSLAGKPIELSVIRGTKEIVLKGELPESKTIGFQNSTDLERIFEIKTIKYGFFSAIGKGFTHTFDMIGKYAKGLKLLVTSSEIKATESLGGFVSFGQMFSTVFDWQAFLELTALVSIILAVMNLLPIPGLDGGYVIFLLFELVSGRKVNDKVMEVATTVGLVLLLGLMLFANGLDIMRLFQ